MEWVDRRLKMDLGISDVSIFNNHLDISRFSVKLVPRLLTFDDKRNRVTNWKECLALFSCNSDEFLHCFIAMNKTKSS